MATGSQKEQSLVVRLRGDIDGSFNTLGEKLTTIGTQVNEISQLLIRTGGESLDVWEKYQKNLEYIKGIMSGKGLSTAEYNKAIETLDQKMTEWAASTSFNTEEISESVKEAARAGLSYTEIIDMIPSAIDLALAGEMDLASATDGLIKVTNAAGLDFADSAETVDMLAIAADSGATTILELVEAIERMGPTAKLSGDFSNLLTQLVILADVGTTAGMAGTLLRNSTIRFLAPTEDAALVLQNLNGSISETGYSLEEMASKTEKTQKAFADFENGPVEEAAGKIGAVNDAYEEYLNTLNQDELRTIYQDALEESGFASNSIDALTAMAEKEDDVTAAFKRGILELNNYALMVAAVSREYDELTSNEEKLDEFLDSAGWLEEYATKHKGANQSIEDYIADLTLKDKVRALNEYYGINDGVSAYDSYKGEDGITREYRINMLNAYQRLEAAMVSMYGDNWQDTAGAIQSLYDVFMIRGITGAMALAQGAVDPEYMNVLDRIENGSEGYGSGVANRIAESYFGQRLKLSSIWENFELTVGRKLAPDVENVYGWLGDLINKVNGMDDNKMSALVSGLEVLAGAGPAILGAGAILKLVGSMMSTPGIIALGATAIGAAARYFNTLSQEEYEDSFGSMAMDVGTVEGYITQLGAAFDNSYGGIQNYANALGDTVENYKLLSQSMSSMLLTSMLTKGELTDADKQQLLNYAESMDDTLLQAIAQSENLSNEFWTTFFAGDENDPALAWALSLTGDIAESAVKEAESLSKQMRGALMSAFEGDVSQDEYQNILNLMRSYNDAMARAEAEAASEEEYITRGKMLSKAQNISYDDLVTLLTSAGTERDARIAEAEDYYLTQRYKLMYRSQSDIEAGRMTQEELDTQIAALDAQWGANKQDIVDTYAQLIQDLWLTGLKSSDVDLMSIYLDTADIVKNWSGFGNPSMSSVLKGSSNDYGEYGVRLSDWISGTAVNPYQYAYKYYSLLEDTAGEEAAAAIIEMQSVADQNPVVVRMELVPGGATHSGTANFGSVSGPAYATGGRATSASIFGEAGAEWAIPERHDNNTADLLIQAAAASGFTWPELAAKASASGGTLIYSPTIYAEDTSGVEDTVSNSRERLEKWYQHRQLIDSIAAY